MTEEHTREENQQHIADLAGCIDYKHFLEYRANSALGMVFFGDPFIVNLGHALSFALDKDSLKIIRTWRSEVDQHEMLWKIHQAKMLAENQFKEQAGI